MLPFGRQQEARSAWNVWRDRGSNARKQEIRSRFIPANARTHASKRGSVGLDSRASENDGPGPPPSPSASLHPLPRGERALDGSTIRGTIGAEKEKP